MASIERTAYPRFRRVVPLRELHEMYEPGLDEVAWTRELARSKEHLLALVVLLKCFQRLGYFPKLDDVPEVIVAHVRSCLGLEDQVLAAHDSNDLRTHILDVEHHPEITYRSTRVEEMSQRRYGVTGDLTIAGNTHPIILEVEIEEAFQDIMGFHRVGFSTEATLRRSDWGLIWNMVLEGGRLVVSEEVKIEIDGALVRKAETAAAPA